MILTTTDGQKNLPRYFATAFSIAQKGQNGRIDFVFEDGRIFRAEGPGAGPVCEVRIHDNGVFERLLREGQLGFCDAYLDSQWSTPDLQAFMDYIHADNEEVFDSFPGQKLVQLYEKFRFWMQGNSKGQARKNISYHYDLGNDFYGLWLDKTMTYSSAIFESGPETLEEAQTEKYASMVDQMGVKPGDHVLEIGCGWGGFAKYVTSEIGAKVTGITISKEQFAFANHMIDEAGLGDKVDLRLMDYRDLEGRFDKIVSIEMFEAVGKDYWPTYFAIMSKVLKKGGRAVVQSITIDHAAYHSYANQPDFIQRYIFPGGMLPSLPMLEGPLADAGLHLVSESGYASHYARTLDQWRQRFNTAWPQFSEQQFDHRFKRMWELYLAYCEGGFRAGMIDVKQMLLMHK